MSYDVMYFDTLYDTVAILFSENYVGGDTLAWNILIPKLDFQSQMKIAQQNQRLQNAVNENADSELRKFKRHIREDKYMWANVSWNSMVLYHYIYSRVLVLENTRIQKNGLSTAHWFGFGKTSR